MVDNETELNRQLALQFEGTDNSEDEESLLWQVVETGVVYLHMDCLEHIGKCNHVVRQGPLQQRHTFDMGCYVRIGWCSKGNQADQEENL